MINQQILTSIYTTHLYSDAVLLIDKILFQEITKKENFFANSRTPIHDAALYVDDLETRTRNLILEIICALWY